MLNVKTPDEALTIINDSFSGSLKGELIQISKACGRILEADIVAEEYVPDFNRSTVDGFAVKASDTFGSSESIPAILPIEGEIKMGETALSRLQPGTCLAVPTGGAVPDCADAVVMLEYTENYDDGTIGVTRPVTPGENLIFRGDDATPGDILLRAGHRLAPHDIGALAALGFNQVKVRQKPVVGIISTGDELIDYTEKPQKGQIRDVNSALLAAVVQEAGGYPKQYGILHDDETLLNVTVIKAAQECDIVLISGGSSVGMKDVTAHVIEQNGSILFHGIAMKPGKPTILGKVGDRPVFGLPGHPVAAYFVSQLFVKPIITSFLGTTAVTHTVIARLGMSISSNHGRAEYIGVRLEYASAIPTAYPLHGKSGLIVTLTSTDGFLSIPRDCEGMAKGSEIQVTLWQ